MERTFNFDRHVFHVILCTTLFFMVVYAIGTTVPAWFVVHEQVGNLSTCKLADYYLGAERRAHWSPEITYVQLSSSLWFLRINIYNSRDVFEIHRSFSSFSIATQTAKTGNRPGMVESVFARLYLAFVVAAFLVSGLIFSCRASTRPSRVMYYGLSAVSIVSAISIWVSAAIHSSQSHVVSVMENLCLTKGTVSSSVYLLTATGSAAICSYVFGFILIHLALVVNKQISEKNHLEEDIFSLSTNSLADPEVAQLAINYKVNKV